MFQLKPLYLWLLTRGKSLLILMLILVLLYPSFFAFANRITETEKQLQKLTKQINLLQKKLAQTHNKQELLQKELARTEKQISRCILQQDRIKNEVKEKEKTIVQLNKEEKSIKEKLNRQQQLLSKHIRTHYQLGEYQPLKWFLTQDEPNQISRIMTYYQYMMRSRQELIENVREIQHKLADNKKRQQEELSRKKLLQNKLTAKQNKLSHDKSYQKQLIVRLDRDIVNKQQRIKEYQQNKKQLSKILKTLAKRNYNHRHKPFRSMRRKLPLPVSIQRKDIKTLNQGLAFLTHEGAPVTAVYPGKVVFSDWLRGYGLLLIIDHGQGFMTLYAHNESLFKLKGDIVEQNEQIASVGHSGGLKENGLYFEIRYKGKTIPPLKWLS